MMYNSDSELRNDYWMTGNEVQELNTRIDGLSSDLEVVNSQLSALIGNVERNLNNAISNAELEIESNHIICDILNSNHGTIDNFYSDQVHLNNTYAEDLRVNHAIESPVLLNAHIENTTSLNGNFESPSLMNARVNFEGMTPQLSQAVVGYGANGELVPIYVTAPINASLPNNAGYIYTDSLGNPRAGNVTNRVTNSSEALVTSGAVYAADEALALDIGNRVSWLYGVINNLSSNIAASTSELGVFYDRSNPMQPFVKQVTNSDVERVEFRPFSSVVSNTYYNAFTYDPENKVVEFRYPSTTCNYNGVRMFADCSNLTTFNSAIPGTVKNCAYMFMNCQSLEQIPMPLPNELVNCAYMFGLCSQAQLPAVWVNDVKGVTISLPKHVVNASFMFSGCGSLLQGLNNSEVLDIELWPDRADLSHMFPDSIQGDISRLNTTVHIPSTHNLDSTSNIWSQVTSGEIGFYVEDTNIINDLR